MTVIPPLDGGIHVGGHLKNYFVYILASERRGTLYIGVTNDLIKRVFEHKNDFVKGFTSKYSIHNLVYHEVTESIVSAIAREKRLKDWNRVWKIELIESYNPEWKDLYNELTHGSPG